MLVRDIFLMSCHNLLLHKIRSLLTSLGVIFGVGSVIAMLSISEGAKRQSLAQIEAMGIDKIIVYAKKPPLTGKDETSSSNASITEEYGLTNVDLENIRKMDNVAHVSTARDARKRILRGITRVDLVLVSVDPEFLQDSGSSIIQGRWFTPMDFANAANVCVIGKNVKRKMFNLDQSGILGDNLRVEDGLYRVVGIIENNRGTQFPGINSPNDMILIPSSTSKSTFGSYSLQREGAQARILNLEYDLFIVKVSDVEYIDDTAKRISGYFTKIHHAVKDWDIVVPLDLLRQREQTQNIFTIVMGSIAGISLIVGGIGIMNIMLANVYERRKEIGTRRALGALKLEILSQFLIETVSLTSIGGLLGVGLGVGLSQLVTYFAKWPTIYSPWSIVVSLFISALVGVVFGTYPAWKAAQQNPIDVLRAE